MRDPDGANLDRVQIVKGWVDNKGETQEQIYNLAVSGNRKPRRNGKYPPVGNTVHLKDATYTNAIGEAYLQAHWKDPDFNPKQCAFYYARVIEIPTPTWVAYDAKAFGSKIPKGAKTIHQERAYTTPVWYTP